MCNETYYDPKIETFSFNFEFLKKTLEGNASTVERYRIVDREIDVVGTRCFPSITFASIIDATLNLAHCHALTAQLNSGTPTEFNELVQSSVDAPRAK